MTEQLLEAWRTNNRMNLGFSSTLSARGGRDVARQFAHAHNNRISHLENWCRDLARRARVFDPKEGPTRKELLAAFEESGALIGRYIERMAAGEPGVKSFKKGLVSAVCYLIAHDSHHRGSILLTLKQSGHKLAQEDAYAIWDWERR